MAKVHMDSDGSHHGRGRGTRSTKEGFLRRIAVALGAVAVLSIGSAVAFGAIPNGDGNIYACYSTGDGTVRVQDDPAKPCAKGWSPLHWAAGQPFVPETKNVVISGSDSVPSTTTRDVTVTCENRHFPNLLATGGGYERENGANVEVIKSVPELNSGGGAIGWVVKFRNFTPDDQPVTVYAVCQYQTEPPAA